ncbi:MAG TPA: hypothetical protein VFL12_01805 [Thermoanaerobaculia bacterium]|nr:hypothetical protein [Thermoanaerobaculia bacterium]
MSARDGAADPRRPLTLRLPNETLAALQVTSAAIRRSTGTALGSSAIIRALIAWLSETDIDTRRVRTPEDFRRQLLGRVRSRNHGESGEESVRPTPVPAASAAEEEGASPRSPSDDGAPGHGASGTPEFSA